MQYYRGNSDVRALAATPENADLDFILEAQKYGLNLYNVGPFNFKDMNFGPHSPYFGKSPTELFINPDEYLVLFGEGQWIEASAKVFNSLFQPVPAEDVPVQKLKGKKFYLDAGHGGKDPGAVNDNLGLQEKIAALDICLFLGRLLEGQGADVLYSRSGDTYPGLTARANSANSWGADAFISIHLNSAANKDASGIETLVYSTTTPAYKLAQLVQENIVMTTEWKNRGVKTRPDLTVLAKTKMPAILCEVGFISNNEQATQLFKIDVQKRLAAAILKGVLEYYG